jgi:hypothetical protein
VGEEFYLYIAPSIRYQYDATTRKSFNDNSAVTFDLIPIRFNGEVGFKYRKIILIYLTPLYTGIA